MKTRLALTLVASAVLFTTGTAAPQAPPVTAKRLSAATIPTEESPSPKLDDWKKADEVLLERQPANCKAHLIREWLKVHCMLHVGGVAEIAGSNKGVLTWAEPGEHMKDRGAEVVMPLRKGDARYFEAFELIQAYAELDWTLGLTISEQWIDGEPGPIVSAVYSPQ